MTDPIPNVNWAGMTLADKYNMMHSGPGGAAAVRAADALGMLAPDFAESASTVRQALASVGWTWQGPSATGFTQAMQRAGEWAEQGSQAPQVGGGQVQTYASSYDGAKNAIPNPAELRPVGHNSVAGEIADGIGAGLDDVIGNNLGVHSDYSQRVAALRAANAKADQALTAHAHTTRSAIASFPTIEQAPRPTNGSGTSAQPNATGDHPGGPGGHSGGPGGGPDGRPPGSGSGSGNTGAGQGSPEGGQGGPSGKPTAPTSTSPSGYTSPPPTNPGWSGGPGGARPGGPGGGGMNDVDRSMPPMPPPMPQPMTAPSDRGARVGPTRTVSPPATREVTRVPARAETGGLSGESAGAAGAKAAGGGMPMGGMGGAGARGEERRHRNNVFIPSDDPFHIEFEDYKDCVPSVIGLDFNNEDDGYFRG